MSKHNYSQYSNKNTTTVEETVAEETTVVEETVVVEETPVDATPVEPVAEVESGKKRNKPTTKHEIIKGVVTGCVKLNVRVKPNINAEPVCVVDANSELKIDADKSNKDWYSVCTSAGIEGYCMRKYIEVKQ